MYPNPLFKLGGGWGNAIFFVTSGFLLSGIKLDIIPWLVKRWKRLVPLTLIMTIISVFIYGINAYPVLIHITRFWFVIALLIYYVPFYFADRVKYGYIIMIPTHILIYLKLYILADKSTFFIEGGGFSSFKVYFYFVLMLLGGFIKRYIDEKKINMLVVIFAGSVGFAIWFVEYFFIKVLNRFFEYQLFIHVGITIFGVSVLLWALSMEVRYPRWNIPKIIKTISESTLEIYLVQIVALPIINRASYPLSIILFWSMALVGGVMLHTIHNRIIGK
jgi:hypothetical protein